jgi:hypothetical protein
MLIHFSVRLLLVVVSTNNILAWCKTRDRRVLLLPLS